jgi:2-phospho-L-lactate guanylyltransferase
MVAIVPVKELAAAKSRLRTVLAPAERSALVLDLLGRVVAACADAGLPVTVVSPDPAVHRVAAGLGAHPLDDGGRDLTGAVALALAHHASAEAAVVLAGDLPYVTADDVLGVLAAADPLAIVAAADGTTNAVAARPPGAFTPAYGPGSALRHGGRRVRSARLERDLDTPADLEGWLAACGV